MNRTLISIGLGLLFIAVGYFGFKAISSSKEEKKSTTRSLVKTVYIEPVKKGTVPIELSANGTLMAKNRIVINSEVQGVFRGSNAPFKAGSFFPKGSVLVRLDNAEFAASLNASKAQLYNQLANLLPDLQLDFPEIFPKWKDYLNAFEVSAPLRSLPEFNSDREKYFINGRGIINSYYAIKNQEERLSKFTIRAPFDGILVEANVTQGSLVSPGQVLGEFINPKTYELELSIPGEFAEVLELGKDVSVKALEREETYEGKLTRINPKIDPTTRMMTTFVELSGDHLSEGQFMEAHISARSVENALSVDRALLLEDHTIYGVNQDSLLYKIPVTPVHFSNKAAVITNVPENVNILSSPVIDAFEGMKVRPISKS